jgi:plasmid segregation protein ParM
MATAKNGKRHHVGVDDGHWGIKIFTEDGRMLTIPSRARSGRHVVGIGESDSSDFYSLSDGGTYTVNEYLAQFEDTRFKEYPKSGLNAILVHHALYKAGFGGQDVAITTGLPVSHYYLVDGTKDQVLIDAKKANLKRQVERAGGQALANIVQADVTTEAIAAYIDLLIDNDGNPTEHAEELQQCTSGFIDIGGRTTDSVVLLPGQQVVTERSGSSDVGVLQLNENVASKLRTKFELDQVPPIMVEKAIREGIVRISGKNEPVDDLVHAEKEKLADQIMAAVRVKIGSGKDLEFVEFVGGGAIVMRDQLAKHFPHARFPDHPEYANARGMMKIAKYIIGGG